MKKYLSLLTLILALGGFTGACVGLGFKVEPFYTWFFCFAWWSCVLAVESVLYRSGGYSLLFEDPKQFLLLLPLSVCAWLVFEAFNFRLENWHYLNVPASFSTRWIFYTLSFASVLPALNAVAALLEYSGLWEEHRVPPLRDARELYVPFVCLGTLCLVLPLAWPGYCFPFVWAGFILLLEPLNHAKGGRSLLRDWEHGALRMFFLLLVSGLICGVLWEMWNYKAAVKWYYTIPFVGGAKLFEMPVMGYLGFAPFAVSCFVMTNAVLLLKKYMKKQGVVLRWALWGVFFVGMLCFVVAVYTGMDQWTVDTFQLP